VKLGSERLARTLAPPHSDTTGTARHHRARIAPSGRVLVTTFDGSGRFIGFQKIFTRNAGLTANGPQRGAFKVPVIGQRQRRAGAIGILAKHGNVFALLNHGKTQDAQGGQNPGLGSIHGKFHKLKCRFGDVSFQSGTFGFQRFAAKGFDMKADGALDIMQGFIKRITFADDDALDADGIGHVTIAMFFDDDFHWHKMPLRNRVFKVKA